MLLLHDLQNQFKHSYFGTVNKELESTIRQENILPQNLLQIYHNNFFISLTERLQNIYPTILKLVGEEFFAATANIYIKQYPPTSGDIHKFGNHFSDFLVNFPAALSLPYLAEVALLEWAYHEAFHEEDSKLFDLTKLQNLSEEKYSEIHFKLHPSARLLSFTYPVMRIWNMCHNKHHQDETINLEEGGENVLIIRCHLEITFIHLSSGEFTLLSAINNGLTFGQSCDLALQTEPSLDINSFLQKHLLCGTIVDIA